MRLGFSGEIWYWRGPAPWYFVTVPDEPARDLAELAARVSYGWGMIPVTVTIGTSTWTTSLWPKDGSYVVPLKARVRAREQLDVGNLVTAELVVDA
jgi:Domain of unknown function (DUF1905)